MPICSQYAIMTTSVPRQQTNPITLVSELYYHPHHVLLSATVAKVSSVLVTRLCSEDSVTVCLRPTTESVVMCGFDLPSLLRIMVGEIKSVPSFRVAVLESSNGGDADLFPTPKEEKDFSAQVGKCHGVDYAQASRLNDTSHPLFLSHGPCNTGWKTTEHTQHYQKGVASKWV